MDNYSANSFFNNFSNLFHHTEKTEDTPVLLSFCSWSEINTEPQNINIQNPHPITCDNDLPIENNLKTVDSCRINSRMTAETEDLKETKILAKIIQPRHDCDNHNTLRQRYSLEKICDNNVETHINTSTDQDEVTIQETPTYTDKELLDIDLQVSMDQGNSWKDSPLTCQGDKWMADGQAVKLSKAFFQEYNNPSLRNTAPAESHRNGDGAGGLQEKVMRVGNTNNITKEDVQYDQECTNKVKEMPSSHMNRNGELCTKSTFQTSPPDINNPISTEAASDKAEEAISTLKSSLLILNVDVGTNINCAPSDTDNEKIQPKEEYCSFLILDTCDGCHVGQSSPETGDIFLKSDQVLNPDSLSETQKERGTNDEQELSKQEIKNGEQDGRTMMEDESDNLEQIQQDILQDNSNSDSLGISEKSEEPTTYTENSSRLSRRVSFSPSLKLEKPPQLPSIFNRLKGLKKEVDDQEEKTLTPEQPKSLFLMKPASVKRALFSEKHSKGEVKGSILEQISQLLSFDAGKLGGKKTQEPTVSPPLSPSSEAPGAEIPPVKESVESPDVASSEESSKVINKETALDAFKAFFTPKAAKTDTSDHIKQDAVKRAFNPETIRAIFDRSSSKSPDNRNIFDNKSPEGEERTPGRLQAVWPPPKPKDKEEKIGLKYTEAEHQAALLHLKRECKEEVEAIEADFKLQLYHLREENKESVARLQAEIADLKKSAKCSHGDLKDAAVSTEDNFTTHSFRTVCIQTDRETFIKPFEEPESSKDLCPQPNNPKKLDLELITHSLSGKQESVLPPLPPPPPPPLLPPLSLQSGFDSVTTLKPSTSLPGLSECYSKTSQSDKCPGLTQGNGSPPPPPPLPTTRACLSPPPPLPGPVPSPSSGDGLFFSRTEEIPQRKPRVEPICPMKPLYWTRIQIQDSRNDTLWSLLKEPAIINTNEFAELFAKMASPAKRKPLSEAYNKTAKAKKIIKVLDSKRSQAVGILISSLHLEMKDIQQAIIMMDNSVVDLDAVEALYENRAQPEELARITKHYEPSDEEHVSLLDKPEQFLYELSLIPQFSLRARCIILQSTFTDAVASIQRKTNMFLQVCKDLLERDSVKDVMGVVLAFGNYMNGGSRNRGQADGFGLDILPKLKDVKSKDNRLNLVDYIVAYYLRNLEKNAGTENCVFPLPEPQDVFLASQVKFEDLSKELRKLGKNIEGCEKNVQSVCLASSQENIHPFKEKMEAFISSAQKDHTAAEHNLISAQKSFHDLVQYFGMKSRSGEQDVLPGHIFMLWFEFCNDFKSRWKRENKAISNERLKEAQQSVRNITADKKVETRQVHANGLKKRLRLKEASLSST